MENFEYDFCGWVTRNDVQCTDGRIIRHNAFVENDGAIVPLVWNHQHDDPFNVLGKVLLHNADGGVYGYGKFNDTEQGRNGKMLVEHGDVSALSIYANQLRQKGSDVYHGNIREVSLVLAGANPKAYIETILSHSDSDDEEAVIFFDEGIELYHADNNKKEESEVADEAKKTETPDEDEETVQDVYDTLTDKQKKVVAYLVGAALEEGANDDDTDEKGENTEMKHNVFDANDTEQNNYLSHADYDKIFAAAKKGGSLRDAVSEYLDGRELMHSIDTTGMDTATGTQTYGFNDPDMLFPDYRTINNTPEWLKRDTDWVRAVLGNVHHTPFSRIKSVYANITEDEARAMGYIKGNEKKTEVFTTLKRSTDPQTIYKLQKMDRDDILDITDFDVVAWIKAEMRIMLDEEIARAILIGDGRQPDSNDKISESHIRPIATDVPLFNTKVNVETEVGATNAEKAKAAMDAIIRARKNYKGSGNPTLFTTEDWLTEWLLLEDGINHKLYKSTAEVATALRVRDIVTVEAMEGYEVDSKPLIGVIVNLADYNVGADKGGAVSLFDDFDLDYNKYEYLIETRISGALVKPFSALTILDAEGE